MPRTLCACSTDRCGRFTAFWLPPLGSGTRLQAPEGPARRCERGARPRPALLVDLSRLRMKVAISMEEGWYVTAPAVRKEEMTGKYTGIGGMIANCKRDSGLPISAAEVAMLSPELHDTR
ncbi:hypothetical protein NDU88_003256 [Pleurodeles waltl]|uniref:Uncharacterized protein n=1 Tax=Pleurodeles waltl TaxID=8319 RepID=A0AAV7SFI6_PLEWA|nr:hypothetical protein NDU88_003256 [Pleurodeles waltl]